MIRAIIADDEALARERLREQLERFAEFDIVAEATDGTEALSAIVTHEPDVAFLDINMPGVSVFASLRSLQEPPLIVFQTAYSEHAATAFDIEALDYLLKPVRHERLQQTVARIREKLAERSADRPQQADVPQKPASRIAVTVNGRTSVIAAEDITRISSEGGFCYIHVRGDRLMSDRYLNYYEGKLKAGRFFRLSRTELINLDHIATIHKDLPGLYTVELKNGMKVDVSRRRAQALRAIVDS
jgi:DNA-binding LytR/AlgR family response regulator